MSSDLSRSALGPVLLSPALNLLRIAAMAAADNGEVDAETLANMRVQVTAGVLDGAAPSMVWPEFERGLLGEAPSRMLRALRDCGALAQLLPEVDALFGVPQSADDPAEVDIGDHVLRVVDEAARCRAPLIVRFAALVFNVGKADSPREHLPSHYRHIERGRPRIESICARFGVPDAFRDFALLAIAECERVHRAAEMRAGSIAALLERVDAFARAERFEHLLTLCAADFRAFPGRASLGYPKAPMLRMALRACAEVEAAEAAAASTAAGADPAEAMLEARAAAVAQALRSARWAGMADLSDTT